jgi:hypothetical protein
MALGLDKPVCDNWIQQQTYNLGWTTS